MFRPQTADNSVMLAGETIKRWRWMGRTTLFTVPLQRNEQNRGKKKRISLISTIKKTERNKRNTPHKEGQCSNKYMQRRARQSARSKSSSPAWAASQNHGVVHTQPYSYHRDSLSSGLSDCSELVTWSGSMPSLYSFTGAGLALAWL